LVEGEHDADERARDGEQARQWRPAFPELLH
jgi:hypothetical protein